MTAKNVDVESCRTIAEVVAAGEPVGLEAAQFPIPVMPSQHSQAPRSVNRGDRL